ncbi:MAG TPA: maleylpyruvate isomerase family mycothiol-dependent enzyme [Streptosporangiaceae bacterium]|nr:maleylpyruvate isomerase family mycothiol-dependent enzyme [Streptosporangiaceae bacterium]
MTDLAGISDALEQSYAAIENLGAVLSPAQWQAQSLCPDWTTRGVVGHVASVENMLVGWMPGSADEVPPFDRVAAFTQQTADLDDTAFAARVAEVFGQRRGDLAALSEDDLSRPSWTPVGPGSYGSFMALRVFDIWVHERDITTPLGLRTDDGDARAEMALAEVEHSLGYIVGKKVGLPSGSSIVFHLTGPLHRDLYVAVDGRAKLVGPIERPDVELSTDSLTFVQLACGRIDPQEQIDAGLVTWTGDAELGDRAARNLRYTM